MKPTNAPAMASTFVSPQVSSKLARFMDFSNNSLGSYIQSAALAMRQAVTQNPLLSTVRNSWLPI
jgi:hypothetical protein